MGHNSAVSGHPISTSFPQVDNWSTNPWVLGRHKFLDVIQHSDSKSLQENCQCLLYEQS